MPSKSYSLVLFESTIMIFLQKQSVKQELVSRAVGLGQSEFAIPLCQVEIPIDKNDVWEIEASLLEFEYKIATGSSGDM